MAARKPGLAERDPHAWMVALVLAIGIATAVNLITLAAVYAAVANRRIPGGLSENATQVLTTAFSGIIGVLGGFFGYRAGIAERERRTRLPGEPPPSAEEPPLDPESDAL